MTANTQMMKTLPTSRIIWSFALLVMAPAIMAQSQPAASTQAPASAAAAQEPTPAAGQPQESSEPQTLHLLVGRSLVITSPSRIKRISLADPDIAEALVVSRTQVLVNGKKPGGVSLLVWDEADQSQAFEVSVDIDVLGLSQKIHEVFPSENVHIDTSRDVVILSGKISSGAVADKILEVVKGAAPKVTSMMEIPPPLTGEILLQVRFAEVDRAAVNQLGFNILSTGVGKTIGATTTGQFGAAGTWNISDLFPLKAGGPVPVGFSVTAPQQNPLNVFLFNPSIHLGI